MAKPRTFESRNVKITGSGTVDTLWMYSAGATEALTNYLYSGRRADFGIGLNFYGARWYDSYHEFGHLINSLPGRDNEFSNQIPADASNIYNGYVNTEALIKTRVTNDPNYPRVQAIQASGIETTEQWADIFANYVAGNIDIQSTEGTEMNDFITDVLFP